MSDGSAYETPEVAAFELGDDRINLHQAGEAAIRLADTVERIRERHLDLTESRAQVAVRRKQHPLLDLAADAGESAC